MTQCVGCGYCCFKTPCDAARRLYPGAKECPQLTWSDEKKRYLCGLMILGGSLGESYRKELYAGAGCCSSLNSWRKDVKNRHHNISDPYENPIPQMFQIFIKCWAQEFISTDNILLTLNTYKHALRKANYSENEVEIITNRLIHYITENRAGHIKEFMG